MEIVAAKMKTLTYQLSNLKFVDEGWTLRRPPDLEISSEDESDEEEHILIPRNLASSTIKVTIKIVLLDYDHFLSLSLSIEIRKTSGSTIL